MPWGTNTACEGEVTANLLMYDPLRNRPVSIPNRCKQLKDCTTCRSTESGRLIKWLHHLWVVDDNLWLQRGYIITRRPYLLYVAKSVDSLSRERMMECRKKRQKASGAVTNYYWVTFEDGQVFGLASENLSPRERLMIPVSPLKALDLLKEAYTSDDVRRRKGRGSSDDWDIPTYYKKGPMARKDRLEKAAARVGYPIGQELPEGVSWPMARRAITAELEDSPSRIPDIALM